jgi:signal transduction histidine kinase/ActR/RegA family two-component response regulator
MKIVDRESKAHVAEGQPALPFVDQHTLPRTISMKQASPHVSPAPLDPHSSRASAVAESRDGTKPRFGDAAFAAVFDSSTEALLVVNAKGIIQRANPRAGELLRCKESGLLQAELGLFLSQPASEEFSKLCALQAASRTLSTVDAALTIGLPVRISFRASLGGAKNLLLCLEEGSIVHRAEGKWLQTEAELTSVLDSIQTGTILLDAAGGIRFCNARFGQYFGMERRQLQSLETFENLAALVAPRFREPENFGAPWKSFVGALGVPVHDELEMTRPTRRILERFARPVLDREGRAVGWLELYYDVTGERQIQSKLLQTEKMAAVGQLVSGIAHELNNPLTAIMGYGQLLLGQGLAPEQYSEASKVFQQAERARRIVKNLLYFARENEPERTRVDLNEIVERTLALRSYELRVENILVECDLASDLPETMADPYQLQQVVLNLLMNAEQALLLERGQGKVKIKTRTADGHRIAMEISDDGPGVPREIASRIFDPFFTTKPSGVGTGLGLSIVYGIVRQHGGEVTFENQNGGGARFVVELPVLEIPANQRRSAEPESAGALQPVCSGRILVVEDEPSVAQLIVDVLREEGHQVEAVLESQEGLARLSRAHYDLVVCDLRMPRLDGPAFYEALIRAGSPAQDHILFVTGDTLAPRTMQFLEKSKLPYLAKPFLVEELKLAVNRRLERSRQAEEDAMVSGSARGRAT